MSFFFKFITVSGISVAVMLSSELEDGLEMLCGNISKDVHVLLK
jgi:hypothetical protein